MCVCVYVCVGSFPHQFILAFQSEVEMDRIKTVTTNVRKLKVCHIIIRSVTSAYMSVTSKQ